MLIELTKPNRSLKYTILYSKNDTNKFFCRIWYDINDGIEKNIIHQHQKIEKLLYWASSQNYNLSKRLFVNW